MAGLYVTSRTEKMNGMREVGFTNNLALEDDH